MYPAKGQMESQTKNDSIRLLIGMGFLLGVMKIF